MSLQLQLTTREDAQWSALGGTTDANGNVTVAAPVGWARIYALRVQYPDANNGPGLTGYVEFQYIQNSNNLLPDNTDPYRVPVTDDSEPVLYSQKLPNLPLQFICQDLRYRGTALNAKSVRVFVLHTLSKC